MVEGGRRHIHLAEGDNTRQKERQIKFEEWSVGLGSVGVWDCHY